MLTSKRVQTREIMQRDAKNKYKPVEKNKHGTILGVLGSFTQREWTTLQKAAAQKLLSVTAHGQVPQQRQDVLHFEQSTLLLPCICCGMSQGRTCSHFLVSQRPWMSINCNIISEMPSGKQKFCKHKNKTISNIAQSQQCILRYLCLKQTLHSFVSRRVSGSCYLLFQLHLFHSISASEA